MTHARRKQAIVGIVGLAVLGSGAYVVTDRLAGDKPRAAPSASIDQTASASIDQTGSAEPSTTPTTPATSAAPAPASRTVSPRPTSAAERVKAAREAGAKHGVPVQRPLPPAAADPSITAADVTVTQVATGKQTLRVASARKNLAGYRELGWVADEGTKVGEVTCSQTFRFSAGMKPAEKPGLLVCWRTSATRSVYTVAANPTGRPARKASVAAIEKRWKQLG